MRLPQEFEQNAGGTYNQLSIDQVGTKPAGFKIIDPTGGTYWSGLDAALYFEHYYVDNLIGFQMAYTENTVPYFSLCSTEAVSYHRGQKLLNGSFSINFRQANYIYNILNRIKGVSSGSASRTPDSISKGEVSGIDLTTLGSLSDAKSAAEYAKRYKEARESEIKNILINKQSSEGFSFHTSKKGFNAYIVFGTYLADSVALEMSSDGSGWELGSIKPTADRFRPGTAYKLKGFALISSQMAFTDSGQPIAETFSFLARSHEPVPYDFLYGPSKPKNMQSSVHPEGVNLYI
jgi:hypothetical protein